jgi:hypothetical protein
MASLIGFAQATTHRERDFIGFMIYVKDRVLGPRIVSDEARTFSSVVSYREAMEG